MTPRAPKPRHLGPDYGAQWQDGGMASAYLHRPSYSEETFEILSSLVPAGLPRTVLDAGCGTGDIARALALRFDRVDAVDASAAMIAVGKQSELGGAANLRWFEAPMETAPLEGPYGLAVAGESIHWMNWDVVFPRITSVLTPGAMFAIVEREESPHAWGPELKQLIGRYSTNQDYAPFDIVAGLEERGWLQVLGRRRTKPVAFTQPREGFIEAIHSRNGFSRARMGVNAHVFDAAFRDLLMRHDIDDEVNFDTWSEIVWGRPLA